jgi:hypothetical protein
MTTTPYLEPKETAKETSATVKHETVLVGLYGTSASPESERRHGQNPLSFNAVPSIEELVADQGVPLSTSFDDLLGKSWPADQSVDDFLEARRRWRREGLDADA